MRAKKEILRIFYKFYLWEIIFFRKNIYIYILPTSRWDIKSGQYAAAFMERERKRDDPLWQRHGDNYEVWVLFVEARQAWISCNKLPILMTYKGNEPTTKLCSGDTVFPKRPGRYIHIYCLNIYIGKYRHKYIYSQRPGLF